MTTHLKDFHRRLHRARKHLNTFDRTAIRFISSIQDKVVTERGSDGVNQVLQIKVKSVKGPPLSLGLIAGDCIHNLRSVLDNLIWQLGNLSGCSKTKMGDLAFPVYKDSTAFDAWKRNFNCLPQPAIDLIGSLQPYQLFKGRKEPDSHPLRVLHRLWNDDKHRSPTLTLVYHKGTAIIARGPFQTIRLANGRVVEGIIVRSPVGKPIRLSAGGSLQEGKEIATIPYSTPEPETQFDVKASFDIAFDKEGPAKGQLALNCLRNLYDFVHDEVLTPFEPIFPK